MLVYPLINFIDPKMTRLQADVALLSGASGVMLTCSHHHDDEMIGVAAELKQTHPMLRVGLNLQSHSPVDSVHQAMAAGVDMLWLHDVGIGPSGLSTEAVGIASLIRSYSRLKLFVSVPCSYRWNEADPLAGEAAKFAAVKREPAPDRDRSTFPGSKTAGEVATLLSSNGFVPLMLWAEASASNPQRSFDRASDMFVRTQGRFAIASGTGSGTIFEQAPYITHIIELAEARLTLAPLRGEQLQHLVARVGGFDPMVIV